MTDGRYICLCEIARGGLGTIELALRHEQSFERLVALKRPREHVREDAATLTAFLREARVAGMIRHKNVVSALDVGEDDRGPFLVMDYVEGVTLGELIATVRRRGDLIPVSVALQIAIGCADGLAAAHELRDHEDRATPVVHRDVSPQNVMIDFEGNVKVLDFGIAKAISAETTAEFLKGKIGYMSPEQLRFEPVRPRSDLFSLGVVLFETLAGRRLFRAETFPEAARRTMHESTPDIGDERGDVPPSLVALLFALLHKEVEARPGSAREVSVALQEITRHPDVDPVSLAEWLEEELAELKASRTQRRIDALTRFRASVASPVVARSLDSRSSDDLRSREEEAPTQVYIANDAVTVVERPRRAVPAQVTTAPKMPWRLGAAVLLILSVASVWWLSRGGDELPSATAPVASTEVVTMDSGRGVSDRGVSDRGVSDRGVSERDADDAPTDEQPPQSAQAGATRTPMHSAMRRRARSPRATMRSAMRTQPSAQPIDSVMRSPMRLSGMRAAGMRTSAMRAVTEDWW